MNKITKATLAALGAFSVTKSKADEINDELVKRVSMSEVNRPEILEWILKEAETQKGEIEKHIRATVQKSVNNLGLPTQKDFKKL